MKSFLDEVFLQSSETARPLNHDDAKQMPIIDYHYHINPIEIVEERKYTSIRSTMPTAHSSTNPSN